MVPASFHQIEPIRRAYSSGGNGISGIGGANQAEVMDMQHSQGLNYKKPMLLRCFGK